jgi:hypothetical protein
LVRVYAEITYVSEILQLNENIAENLRPEFMLRSWNNGILEGWISAGYHPFIYFAANPPAAAE